MKWGWTFPGARGCSGGSRSGFALLTGAVLVPAGKDRPARMSTTNICWIRQLRGWRCEEARVLTVVKDTRDPSSICPELPSHWEPGFRRQLSPGRALLNSLLVEQKAARPLLASSCLWCFFNFSISLNHVSFLLLFPPSLFKNFPSFYRIPIRCHHPTCFFPLTLERGSSRWGGESLQESLQNTALFPPVYRYIIDIQIYRYTDIQLYRYRHIDIQVYRYTDTHADTQSRSLDLSPELAEVLWPPRDSARRPG